MVAGLNALRVLTHVTDAEQIVGRERGARELRIFEFANLIRAAG